MGVGKIKQDKSHEAIVFYVNSLKDLIEVIIPFFDKYPLVTQKQGDYILFKQAIELIKNKEHLTVEGLTKIVSIKASMNKGLSKKLVTEFSDITPVLRPQVTDQVIKDPNWLAGFVDGEGCFFVSIYNSPLSKLGVGVSLFFSITQHQRDELLMKSLIEYLNCGRLIRKRDVYEYQVTKYSDIKEKIIPFFNKYPILGKKSKDLAEL